MATQANDADMPLCTRAAAAAGAGSVGALRAAALTADGYSEVPVGGVRLERMVAFRSRVAHEVSHD